MIGVIERNEERVIEAYHTAEGYLAADEAEPRQAPLLTPAEVEREIHTILVASVMVGVPD